MLGLLGAVLMAAAVDGGELPMIESRPQVIGAARVDAGLDEGPPPNVPPQSEPEPEPIVVPAPAPAVTRCTRYGARKPSSMPWRRL